MKDIPQEELQDVDQTVRLRQSLQRGVFIDEHGRENPHVGFARCHHGELVSKCERCAKEKA